MSTAPFRSALALVPVVLLGCSEPSMPSTTDGGVLPGTDGGVLPGADAAPPPLSPLVDPACTDGRYTEALPDPNASLADVSFSGDVPGFVDAVLDRRYPFGASLVRGGRMNTSFGDCSVLFSGGAASAADVYRSLSTIVHECGHLYDGFLSRPPSNHYDLRAELSFMCARGDTTSRGGATFERSRIRNDTYQPLRPACAPGTAGRGCDSYANIYLDGDPDDATFQGGDQGFNMLLEETVQYVNSLATERAFDDQRARGSSTSARDGILTFLWYVERYLHMARLDHPDAYTAITSDACWRDAILTVWGRAWLYLEATRGAAGLGIEDEVIEALVLDPVLLDEIERIRAASGC